MSEINKVSTSSYRSFRQCSLLPNAPVLLPASLSSSWACLSSPSHSFTTKTTHDNESAPAYDNIAAVFGDIPITVIDCAASCAEDDSEAAPLPAELERLLALWARGEGTTLYLKDWHLPRILAESGRSIAKELYEVPSEWADDWLNAFWAAEKADDFRFLDLGGGDTFTPLHRDVFGSYSISTNLHGSKLWTLFPPNCAPDILKLLKEAERSEEGDGSVDVRRWSTETKATFAERGMVEVTQAQGESIFIPSGWYHQVTNLSHPTFSLNHNWINAHNIRAVYSTLERDTAAARESIDDVRQLLQSERTRAMKELEWSQLKGRARDENVWRWETEFEVCVGDLLRQNVGWDWITFWRMVKHALSSIAPVQGEDVPSGEWPLCAVSPASQPPVPFVHEQVEPILNRFKARMEMEWRWADGLEQVLGEVEAQLRRLQQRSRV